MATWLSRGKAHRAGAASCALAMSLVLVVALLFAASCGGDAAAAKSDMSSGDAALTKLKPTSDELVKQISALFQGVFSGGKVDAASFKKSADAIKVTTGKLSAGAGDAREQYAMIDSLKAVPSYKQYADLQIQAIELNNKQTDSLNAFLDKWSAGVAQPTFDPVTFVGASRDLSVQMDATSAAIAKLEAQAAALKKSKKL